MKRKIDHIVYAVLDLEEACNHIENSIGVRPVIGGFHETKGTKNALLNIGQACYLEILAVDDENKKISGPRWMGVDLINQARVTRWSLKSNQLKDDQAHLQSYDKHLGHISGGSRQTPTGDTLKWNMILPLAQPAIDIIPFMTDWTGSSIHPTDRLTEECELVKIEFAHPEPTKILTVFKNLGLDVPVREADELGISITLKKDERTVNLY